ALAQWIIDDVVYTLVSAGSLDASSVDRLVTGKYLLARTTETLAGQKSSEPLPEAPKPKPAPVATPAAPVAESKPAPAKKSNERPWTTEEIAILIKAVSKFPGGSRKRWETISEYVAVHSGQAARSNEELIAKSKDLQRGATSMQADAVRQLQFVKKHADTRINDEPSIRFDVVDGASEPASASAATAAAAEKPADTAVNWTSEQQQQLEKALKTYPASWKGEGDRWDMIAAEVEGRNKREVKLRVKFLMEQIKAKKAATS
ncbi:hypothetical protein THASP1DRAFT_22327, partial [Thamnocephalis sphaerospora]